MKRNNILSIIIIAIFELMVKTGSCQVPVTDYLTFTNRVDFTIFGTSNNRKPNTADGSFNCQTDNLSTSTQNFSLPPNSTIRKALLYWAGSGTGDFEIKFSGPGFSEIPITAERTFNTTVPNAPNQTFFSASYDVTGILQMHGEGNYTVSELDADRASPYCADHVFSGWVVVVVYENPVLIQGNTVKIYDGLQGIKYSEINFNLNNLYILSTDVAKLAFVSWEGESGVGGTEWMKVNGNKLSNSLNPINGIYNGTNSFTGSAQNYNMDLDFFNIADYINIGDENIAISTHSGDDMTIFNIFAISYINKAPDANVEVENVLVTCDNPEIEVKGAIRNFGNDTLYAGTRIGFYLNSFPGTLLGTYQTTLDLLPGTTLNITENLTLPDNITDSITIVAVIDDLEAIVELNETNNLSSWQFVLPKPSEQEVNYTLCEGDTLFINERYYTRSTQDTLHFLNAAGCDSTLYLTITQLFKSADTINVKLCHRDIFTFPDSTTTDTAGTFRFLLMNNAGCDSNLTIRVDILSESNFFTLGEDITVNLGHSKIIRPVFNFTPDSVIWSPDTYLEDVNEQDKRTTPYFPVTYVVTATDEAGCTYRDTLHVEVLATKNIYFPNVFSPNNDGINDVFRFFTDVDVKVVKQFKIFDRWGELVFQQNEINPADTDFGWRGTYRGKTFNPGVFVFFAEVEFLNGDIHFYTGDVTLIR